MEKEKHIGPPPPAKPGADEPPKEPDKGLRESPLGPGEHQDEPPADAPKE